MLGMPVLGIPNGYKLFVVAGYRYLKEPFFYIRTNVVLKTGYTTVPFFGICQK